MPLLSNHLSSAILQGKESIISSESRRNLASHVCTVADVAKSSYTGSSSQMRGEFYRLPWYISCIIRPATYWNQRGI